MPEKELENKTNAYVMHFFKKITERQLRCLLHVVICTDKYYSRRQISGNQEIQKYWEYEKRLDWDYSWTDNACLLQKIPDVMFKRLVSL